MAKARYRIGVDLGGTKLAAGVVDPEGNILGEAVTYDHRGLSEEAVLARMERNIDAALARAGAARADVKGVGVLFPGHIRWPEGVTLTTSNLPGFKGFPLRERMEARLGIPCLADNDANAQALGEYRYGAGRGLDPLVFMTVSTGIGGGIVIDGKLYRGFRSDIPGLKEKVAALPDPPAQETDFARCVRDRRTFALNEANAHRSCTLVNLAKIAVRLNRPLRFDPDRQAFLDDEEANRLIHEPMRAPWTL
jgi:hypothetical protein